MIAANENYYIKTDDGKSPLPEGWESYDRITWSSYGPIGFSQGSFVYLDPEIKAWRG